MNILIDKDGDLWLERGVRMLAQYCPYSEKQTCGHFCPHFGEPEMSSTEDGVDTLILSCGNGRKLYGTIKDERSKA